MVFKYKLSKRLAISWLSCVLFLPHLSACLPFAIDSVFLASACVYLFVKLRPSVRPFYSSFGERRAEQVTATLYRRLSDDYLCWELFLPRNRLFLRLAFLGICKVDP